MRQNMKQCERLNNVYYLFISYLKSTLRSKIVLQMFWNYERRERNSATHHFIFIHMIKIPTELCEVLGNVNEAPPPRPSQKGGILYCPTSPIF